MTTPSSSDRLVRPIAGRVFGGVCLALAHRFGFDITAVRVATALVALFTGVGLVLYIALWIVIPSEV